MTGASSAPSTWVCPRSRSPSIDFTRWGAGDPGWPPDWSPATELDPPLDVTATWPPSRTAVNVSLTCASCPAWRLANRALSRPAPVPWPVAGGFDRILGSLHAVPVRGRLAGLPAMFGMFGRTR